MPNLSAISSATMRRVHKPKSKPYWRGSLPLIGAASKAADLGGERPLPSIARFRTASISDGRDQLNAGVFSRRQTCQGKSQEPCSSDGRIAGVSKSPKVLKAHRQGLPWGDYESPGRNNSKRRCSLENARSEGRDRHRRAKAAWGAEI